MLVYLRDRCCHTEIEAADQTLYLTQSQRTDTGSTSPSADLITPGAWQGSQWSANFLSHWYDSTPGKIPSQTGFEPRIFRSRGGRLNRKANEAVEEQERFCHQQLNEETKDGDKSPDGMEQSRGRFLRLLLVRQMETPVSSMKVAVHRRSPPRWPSGKASASRAEDPGFEARFRRDFF